MGNISGRRAGRVARATVAGFWHARRLPPRQAPAPGSCESGECGFPVGFRTEAETAARDRDRENANPMKLQRRRPWQQLRLLSLFNLLIGMEHAGRAVHDDAPAFGSIVVVGLEKNTIVYRGAD